MTEAKLQLLGPCTTWQGAARLGRLELPDGSSRRVLALLGPEGASDAALARARQAAGYAIALRGAGVLPLLDVVRVVDRVAWVYQEVDALGLGHTVGSEGSALLSTRAAAEVVARVAEILLGAGPEALRHPGPEPTDLLLDATGRLHLASFVGPFPPAPSMRAPGADDPATEAAVVYRLGVLLAHLVSGVPTTAASERSAHAALVRRALIRAMARPGPVLTERYGDWIRGMLAWEPAERPPLSAVPDGLRKVAEATGGERLGDWAEAHVAWLAARAAERGRAPSDGESTDATGTDEISSPRTDPPPRRASPVADELVEDRTTGQQVTFEAPPREELTEDDPTQEASALAEAEPPPAPRRPPARAPAVNSLPVAIGPPPEALKRSPRLPSGFLDESTEEEDSDGVAGSDPYYWLYPASFLLLVTFLGAVALLLLAFIAWPTGGGEAPSQPSLADILREEEGRPQGAPPVTVEHSVVVEGEEPDPGP